MPISKSPFLGFVFFKASFFSITPTQNPAKSYLFLGKRLVARRFRKYA